MKRIAILGSTGSIGVSTLQVVDALEGRFEVVALAAGRNLDRLEEQVRRYRPELVSVRDATHAEELRRRLDTGCRIVHGIDGAIEVATVEEADVLVSAFVGAVGLRPTHAALEAGRDVALANKETLVVAGEEMTRVAEASGARLLPVDSEHNALHQCLRGEQEQEVRNLWLTASGGPFRGASAEDLVRVTPEQALRHPTWKMGPKVTIDSATLMNKGLEVVEARWLFGLGPEAIRVVVHPQSVVHSMVEFVDGSFKAQLGITDMRHPIQYALCWPERWETTLPPFDPVEAGPLEFARPDRERFPCLDLAFRALRLGGDATAVLNAANEIAVQAFLEQRIGFTQIPELIAEALDRESGDASTGIEGMLAADARTRLAVQARIDQGVRS